MRDYKTSYTVRTFNMATTAHRHTKKTWQHKIGNRNLGNLHIDN